MWSIFLRWLVLSGAALAFYRVGTFLGFSMPDGVIRAAGGVVPLTFDSAGINAATTAVAARGTGFVALLDAVYTLTPGVPLIEISGVSHYGVAPKLLCTTAIFDADWSITGGTRIIGDGSTDAFTYNNVDLANPIANFASNALISSHKKNIAFIGTRRPLAIGAKNSAGSYNCKYNGIYLQDNTVGPNMENYAHCQFDFIFDRNDAQLGSWAWRWASSVSSNVVEPGNSRWGKRIFTTRKKIRQHGFVFEASNGSISNQLIVEALQSNRFSSGTGGVEETDNFTFPASGTAITMADATKYPANFPFVLSTAVGGFLVGPQYYFNATGATTGTLSARAYGLPLASTGAGTVQVKTQGYALVEIQSMDNGTTAGVDISSFTNCEFRNMDVEGTSSASVQAFQGVNNRFNISQPFASAYANLVLRNQQHPVISGTYPITTDLDAASADAFFTGARGNPVLGSYAGRGLWVNPANTGDGIKGALNLNARSVATAAIPVVPSDLQNEQYAGVGSVLRAGLPLIQPNNFFTAGATLNYTVNGATSTYNGTGSVPGSFADVAFLLPVANANFVGHRGEIVHAGTGVMTLGTQGGTLIDLISGLTQLYATPGQLIRYELCKSSASVLYWDMKVIDTGSPKVQAVTGAVAAGTAQLTSDPSDALCTISGTSLTTYTVAVPTDVKSVIGQRRRISFLTAVSALTVNGATNIYNAPASAFAGDTFEVTKINANMWSFIK